MSTVKQLAEKLAGDLEREVTADGEEIEIPFAHREALVIGSVGDPDFPKSWELTAYAWDASGGVSDEKWIGNVPEGYVACLASTFLTEMDARDAWALEL